MLKRPRPAVSDLPRARNAQIHEHLSSSDFHQHHCWTEVGAWGLIWSYSTYRSCFHIKTPVKYRYISIKPSYCKCHPIRHRWHHNQDIKRLWLSGWLVEMELLWISQTKVMRAIGYSWWDGVDIHWICSHCGWWSSHTEEKSNSVYVCEREKMCSYFL